MTPNDAIRLFDGEFQRDDTDRHDPQLHYLLPALAVFAVAALVWMVLAK